MNTLDQAFLLRPNHRAKRDSFAYLSPVEKLAARMFSCFLQGESEERMRAPMIRQWQTAGPERQEICMKAAAHLMGIPYPPVYD